MSETTVITAAQQEFARRRMSLVSAIMALSKQLREMDEQAMPLPDEMEPHFYREWPVSSGSLTIEIVNAGHFSDSVNFASKNGVEEAFWRTFNNLLRTGLGPALAQKEFIHNSTDSDGKAVQTVFPARDGRAGHLRITPDSSRYPSFNWLASVDGKHGLHGGMICHRRSRDWSLHT
jgi:hypothetical protein